MNQTVTPIRHRFAPGPEIMNWAMFLSSYMLLFVALAVRFHDWRLRLACGLLAAIGLLSLRYILATQRRISSFSVIIRDVEDRGPEVSGYLATYLLPLLVVPDPSPTDLIAYALILYVFGAIYVRSRMMQINPTLYVFGFGKRLFYITTDGGLSGYLIAFNAPAAGSKIRIVQRGELLFEAA